jgi:hypothetical protein
MKKRYFVAVKIPSPEELKAYHSLSTRNHLKTYPLFKPFIATRMFESKQKNCVIISGSHWMFDLKKDWCIEIKKSQCKVFDRVNSIIKDTKSQKLDNQGI